MENDKIKLTKEDEEFIKSVKDSNMDEEQKNKLQNLVKINRQFMITISKAFEIKIKKEEENEKE